MLASMSIHPIREHHRTSSPPPQPGYSESRPTVDLPWTEEEEQGDDEVLESDVTEVITVPPDSAENKDKKEHEVLFDWSEDLFPDEDAAVIGEKRPLDVLDILGRFFFFF
ncbi:hypothetical protein OESDEN_16451 [Oesophagostomum dentatum]|uniref:Uncharacterized protein n=1 Tax=Oesophagostomum dentatum TaxID=61180 RepID=A0A0B1SFY7_OESDE|nr:hypothetical protein OESDEN_16451 [Oesophagostomum dentatum]